MIRILKDIVVAGLAANICIWGNIASQRHVKKEHIFREIPVQSVPFEETPLYENMRRDRGNNPEFKYRHIMPEIYFPEQANEWESDVA